MTPEDHAAIHARAFDSERAWSIGEFKALVTQPNTLVAGDARAFVLGRVVADEAEVLTLATDPAHRRHGLARAALAEFEHLAAARGASRVFLEVAVDNEPARGLYASAGYSAVGRRTAYYRGGVDALILEKRLHP